MFNNVIFSGGQTSDVTFGSLNEEEIFKGTYNGQPSLFIKVGTSLVDLEDTSITYNKVKASDKIEDYQSVESLEIKVTLK